MKSRGLVLFLCIVVAYSYARQHVKMAQVTLRTHSDLYDLAHRDITILDAGEDFARVLVQDTEIEHLRAAGYSVDIIINDYQAYKDSIFERGFYHTYNQVYAVLDSFAQEYPSICRLDTLGFSVQGRAMWAMRVTDNPGIEENEPEIRLIGNMHGDEHIGTEVTLYFLRYLLTEYASNSHVRDMVNNCEFWIAPTINPDGKVANRRTNANDVDLNRDYGFFWAGWGDSPSPNSQIETKVMVEHLEENDIVLEYNYHSAAEYVNYPWDYHQADPPDSQYFIDLSTLYAAATGLTVTNGYDWYQVTGSLQDYTFGTSGALAWTIETPEPANSSLIDQICYENRDALLIVCERARWGIEGVVTDSLTGVPLLARVEFNNPDRTCIYSDPHNGDFHKMIAPGTYDVVVLANGYMSKYIDSVVVPATGSIALGDVELTQESSARYAFRVVLCRFRNHDLDDNKTRPRFALGPPDSRFFSLGRNGYVVFDMGALTPIVDIPGNDFVVYEGDDGLVEGYYVYVSNSWEGPWLRCDSAGGTAFFDMAGTGLAEARYVRIVDDADITTGQYAGFDVDAVQSFSPVGTEEQETHVGRGQWQVTLAPNPFRNSTTVLFPVGSKQYTVCSVQIYDVAGCLVKQFSHPTVQQSDEITWDATDETGHAVSAGIYFVKVNFSGHTVTKKVILAR
jgi:hypothetical protein